MTVMSVLSPPGGAPEPLSRPGGFAPPATAVVRARDGRDATIARGEAILTARIAFGCLVRPEPGDHVATVTDGDTVWIVAVLERPTEAPAHLFSEGNIAITSARGDISLLAAGEVNIDAGARTRIAAKQIDLHAGVARFVLDELLHVGRRARLYVTRIRSVGEIFETFAEHVLTRAKRGTRLIEESDQLRAGDVDHRAEGTLQLRAKTAFITADTVVRLDAEQIHMG